MLVLLAILRIEATRLCYRTAKEPADLPLGVVGLFLLASFPSQALGLVDYWQHFI
jgi:hypothetical protein